MTIVKISDESLEDVSGGVLVEVPARGRDTDFVLCDERKNGLVASVYGTLEAAQKAARQCGRSDEVITPEEYEKRFRTKFRW